MAGEPSKEESAASAKAFLQKLDSAKLGTFFREVFLTIAAFHLVTDEGGNLARLGLYTYALSSFVCERIEKHIDFSDEEDIEDWMVLFYTVTIYGSIGAMSFVLPSLAFHLDLTMYGAMMF